MVESERVLVVVESERVLVNKEATGGYPPSLPVSHDGRNSIVATANVDSNVNSQHLESGVQDHLQIPVPLSTTHAYTPLKLLKTDMKASAWTAGAAAALSTPLPSAISAFELATLLPFAKNWGELHRD